MNGSPRHRERRGLVTARLRSARIAIAIERLRISHDHQPPPDPRGAFIPALAAVGVLIGPFDGQPLRYKFRDPWHVVHSVGEKINGNRKRVGRFDISCGTLSMTRALD